MNAWRDLKSSCHRYFLGSYYVYCQKRLCNIKYGFKVSISSNKKNVLVPFYGWGSRLESHHQELVYILPLSPKEFLVLILLTLEGSKAESHLQAPSVCLEPWPPGVGIQCPNHQDHCSKVGSQPISPKQSINVGLVILKGLQFNLNNLVYTVY